MMHSNSSLWPLMSSHGHFAGVWYLSFTVGRVLCLSTPQFNHLSLSSHDSRHDRCPALSDRRVLQQLWVPKHPCRYVCLALLFALSTQRQPFKFLRPTPLGNSLQSFISYYNDLSEYSKYSSPSDVLFIMPLIATKDEKFAAQSVQNIRVHAVFQILLTALIL